MSIDTTVYHGAVKGGSHHYVDGVERWRLTSNLESLSEVPDDEVIWAGSIEELVAKLEELHPPSHGLTHISKSYGEACVWPHPVIDISELVNEDEDEDEDDDAPYNSDTHVKRREQLRALRTEHILNAAKIAGTICIDGYVSDLTPEIYDQCIVTDQGHTIEYNPNKATKKREKEHKKSLTQPVPTYAIYRCMDNLRDYLRLRFEQPVIKGNLSRAEYLDEIKDVLWHFEALFGKGIFRKTTTWQAFVKEWKEQQGPTEKMFAREVAKLGVSEQDKNWVSERVKTIEEFVAFMAIEVKKRMPKALKKEEILKLGAEITLPGTPKKAKSCESVVTANKSVATLVESGTP